jgi:hypothetical protein
VKKITIVTIILFSIGIISASLIGYNYFTSIHVISKQQAIDLAIKYGQWTPQALRNDIIDAKLLQAKLSNQVALVLNDSTMSYEPYPVPLRANYVKENQLFWEVTITRHLVGSEYHEWVYEIDAMNGTRIESIG